MFMKSSPSEMDEEQIRKFWRRLAAALDRISKSYQKEHKTKNKESHERRSTHENRENSDEKRSKN